GWRGTHYKNTTGRNDIVLAKAARDEDFVYFYCQTADAMTSPGDPGWMRLFIDVDRNKATGWEGYDFMVNQVGLRTEAALSRSLSGWNWDPVGRVALAVGTGTDSNKLEIRMPRKMLQLNAGAGGGWTLDIEFKWSD